jgi:ferredoxin
MAIARAAKRTGTRASLIFGNRSAADVIFSAALDELGLPVRHVLDSSGERLDRPVLARELDALAPGPDAHYFVCGPAGAMAAAREELRARGVPAAQLHEERFATAERKVRARAAQPLTVRRGATIANVVVPPDATLLDAALAAGVDLPYSCAMGGCGACAVDLTAGEVDLDEPNCLAPDERARGRVLACVARPCGPCAIEVAP